jgi:hypothetical protein
MINRSSFGSKYISVPTNNISSRSASSRKAIFTGRADIEQSKVSDVPTRNSKTKSFPKIRTEFRKLLLPHKNHFLLDI